MYEPGVVIREARKDDLRHIVPLIVRFYRFNEEFDPAWSTKDLSESEIEEILKKRLEAGDILLVAEMEGRIIGFLRAEISENLFLENDKIVVVKELYVRPEFRRRGVARRLIDEASRALRRYGAKILAAEFPSLNIVANNFYKNLGFRSYVSVYIKEA